MLDQPTRVSFGTVRNEPHARLRGAAPLPSPGVGGPRGFLGGTTGTRPGSPIVHSAVAVDLGAGSCSVAKGTEQPLGLRPAGLTTRLHATHASIYAADASSALPGGGGLTARSATATKSPASSVSPLAPIHSRGAGWAQLV